MASALFGVEGLQVTDVQAGPGGVLGSMGGHRVPAAAACPECAMISDRVHESVVTRARARAPGR